MTEVDKLDISQEELLARLASLETKLEEQKRLNSKITFNDIGPRGPKATMDNSIQLFDHYSISIKYNEMRKDIEITIPGKDIHPDTEMNTKLAYIQDYARQQGLPITDIFNHVNIVANQNAYHPIRDWIDSVKWDGFSRIEKFYETIDSSNVLKKTLMRKWALSGAAAIYHPGFSCEGVLTLYGTQGIGKTTWAQRLLPVGLANSCSKDGLTLNVHNKDSVYQAINVWITELGELSSTFKKSDIEALKGFITLREDSIRPPYERKTNNYSRMTIFLATVDKEEFLQDDENRRFWTIDVNKFVDVDFDAQQFWAEMKEIYLSIKDKIATASIREKNQEWGWFLSPTERRTLYNTQHQFKSIDPIEEMLSTRVKMPTVGGEWLNATAILIKCRWDKPGKREANVAAKWLRTSGFMRKPETKQFYVDVPDGYQIGPSDVRVPKFRKSDD